MGLYTVVALEVIYPLLTHKAAWHEKVNHR